MKVFSMSNAIGKVPSEIHIVPIGEWKERGFRITKEDCADIIRNYDKFGIKLVIDYEHQSLNCVNNGEPAPAAGWIGKLEARDNGVWALELEWTAEAKQYIEEQKYRYISPVLIFDDRDPHTDSWIGCSLLSVALTNIPYFRDDLEPIINSRYGCKNKEEAARDSAKETSMTLEEQLAASQKEVAAKEARISELEKQIAAKDAILAEAETKRMVDEAITAKKLLPAQREVGVLMAKQGKEVFDKFIAANVIPDLGKAANVPQDGGKASDLKAEYQELLKRPGDLMQLHKDDPARYEALRKAYYGG